MYPIRQSLRKLNSYFFSKPIQNQILRSRNDYSNISPKIIELVDNKIHEIEGHPLNTIKERMRDFFQNTSFEKSSYQTKIGNVSYDFLENINPIGLYYILYI